MNIPDLIKLLQKKIAALNSARSTAYSLGDVDQVMLIDAQITETQLTLDQLNTLV